MTDTTERKPIGAALREAREAAGLTVAEAAAELGVERTTLYRWEQGTRTPSVLTERVLREAVSRWLRKGAKR